MNQNSIPHLVPHTGFVQVQENTPMFIHRFSLRVEFLTWVSVLKITDLQDNPKLYGFVSIESCILFSQDNVQIPLTCYNISWQSN